MPEFLSFPCPYCNELRLTDSNVSAPHAQNWPYYCHKCNRNINYLLCSCDRERCNFAYCKPDKFKK